MTVAPSAGLGVALRGLDRDGRLLFAARVLRMFAYGSIAVILALYLAARGFDGVSIGVLLALTLVGDTAISLWLTTHADRYGRRRVLTVGALLMIAAGVVFAATGLFPVLLAAAVIGVISPSGNEVGPFLAVEQAALSQATPGSRRTSVFAWYNLAGSIATAVGSLAGGITASALQRAGASELDSYRAILVAYAVLGGLLALAFARVSAAVEAPRAEIARAGALGRFGLRPRSRSIVVRLAALFSIDAFAGGLVPQSLLALWFHLRFGVDPAVLGAIFFGANILAAVSSLLAATMVFTHLPSNVLLILVPLMPNLPLAIAMLLIRFSISQMDVPARQSYTMAVVDPDERSAAAGVTGIARTSGASVSPVVAGPLLVDPMLAAVPFFLAGGLKIVYDLLLYRAFRSAPPPDESDR